MHLREPIIPGWKSPTMMIQFRILPVEKTWFSCRSILVYSALFLWVSHPSQEIGYGIPEFSRDGLVTKKYDHVCVLDSTSACFPIHALLSFEAL
jgi:hypothetical protein